MLKCKIDLSNVISTIIFAEIIITIFRTTSQNKRPCIAFRITFFLPATRLASAAICLPVQCCANNFARARYSTIRQMSYLNINSYVSFWRAADAPVQCARHDVADAG